MSEPSPRGKKERSSTRDRKESSRKEEGGKERERSSTRERSSRKKEELTSSSESSATEAHADDKKRLRSASSRSHKSDSSKTHSPRTKTSDRDEKREDKKEKGKEVAKESSTAVVAATKKGGDESRTLVPSEAVVRPIQIAADEELDGEAALFGQQKEALLMLLEARMLLTKMVRWRWIKEQNEIEERRKKTQEEKKKKGKLSVTEIQSVLKSQPDGEDGDWTSGAQPFFAPLIYKIDTYTSFFVWPFPEIQELKRQLVIEIRRNHVLDRDLQKLDKRIGLLIKNRTTLQVRCQDSFDHVKPANH
jgi:hypothetical protein